MTKPTKVCVKCGDALPATTEYFLQRKNGLSGGCRPCAKRERKICEAKNAERISEQKKAWAAAHPGYYTEWKRAWRAKNHDKAVAYERAYREANLAHLKEARKRNYSENQERDSESFKRWRLANLEHRNAYAKQWQVEHPELMREFDRNKRAKRKNAPGTHTAQDVRDLLEAQDWKCAYCDVDVTEGYHVDHIEPLARGGSNWPENLAIACPTCNTRKGAMDPIEFLEGAVA